MSSDIYGLSIRPTVNNMTQIDPFLGKWVEFGIAIFASMHSQLYISFEIVAFP